VKYFRVFKRILYFLRVDSFKRPVVIVTRSVCYGKLFRNRMKPFVTNYFTLPVFYLMKFKCLIENVYY